MVDCAVAGRKPLVCRTVFCGYTGHLHKPSILQEPQFPDTGGIHLGGMTLDRFLINAASPLGKQLRPVIVQGALMAAGSLVGKDGFPTIAHTLRHKLQVQSGERPFPFLFIREQVQIRCANGITDFFFSEHLVSSVFSLHTGRGPQSHGRTF